MNGWWVWPVIAGLGAVIIVLGIALAYAIHLLMHMFDGF